MRSYSFSEARQKFAEVLDRAKTEDVVITRRGGDCFVLSYSKPSASPFDVPGIAPGKIKTRDIVEAVRSSRAQSWRGRG